MALTVPETEMNMPRSPDSTTEERPSQSPAPVDGGDPASTLTLDRTLWFSGPDGREIELGPGAYRVQVRSDGHIDLRSWEGTNVGPIEARSTWHELQLNSPLTLTLPAENEGQHVVVLFPGGGMLDATGSYGRTRSGGAAQERTLSTQALAEAVLKWLPASPLPAVPWDKAILPRPWTKLWGAIEPGPSPTGFGPSSVPPNWIGATVATCYVPPAGSYGPGGPGTESGIPVFPPGSAVLRGPFAAYLLSVTPVTVSSSLSMAGKLVRLLVTSHVVTLGYPTILSMTWTDVYHIVPQTDGSVTFPGVVVATGRVPTSPPPPATTWAAEVAKRLTSTPGWGTPTEFELQLYGMTVATRSCRYNAGLPGAPALFCS